MTESVDANRLNMFRIFGSADLTPSCSTVYRQIQYFALLTGCYCCFTERWRHTM